jgi:DNA-binding PadR family transcriptional regulator
MEQRLSGGFIRLHVLHHALQGPIFGLGIIGELGRHGYRLGPGTLYPILHGMERDGLLRSASQKMGRTVRRTYVTTAAGRRTLKAAKRQVWELVEELFEEELSRAPLASMGAGGKSTTKKGRVK